MPGDTNSDYLSQRDKHEALIFAQADQRRILSREFPVTDQVTRLKDRLLLNSLISVD